MTKSHSNVLIIGGPNAGKTHFGGQLYGRLNSAIGKYKITSIPDDLTIFQEVLDRLSEGKSAGHTETSALRHLELKIEDKDRKEIKFSFPDYAGEQVNMIVEGRKVNNIWKDYIVKSTSWVLFIRLDEIAVVEDIVNRGIPGPDIIKQRQAQTPPIKISDGARFVELLQTLLYFKGISVHRKTKNPKLTIVLSCWDILKLAEKTVPSELLSQRIPLLFNFVKSSWEQDSFDVIGLSSTERTLTDQADKEYVDKGPENFGYLIDPKGRKEKDLTLSIATFIGAN